ncbi:uncharacterized protein Dere_GG26244 [Drosophila erecta]|uniref:Uncharacterized protein n=1 Tax=Drosophila erecta TaxID=7220 RepID=A0A0Q5VKR0_DROER|nr:uncharacterized protein Dere_GG26244 [Drosophila erecta]
MGETQRHGREFLFAQRLWPHRAAECWRRGKTAGKPRNGKLMSGELYVLLLVLTCHLSLLVFRMSFAPVSQCTVT